MLSREWMSLCRWTAAFAFALVLALPRPGGAFEALDGRLQVHGFAESQIRVISADLTDDYDLTQWYNVLNLEFELDLVEDFGLVSLASAYMRLEARYDCIYSDGCGMIESADTYGDDARELPERLSNAVDVDGAGVIPLPEQGLIDFSDPPRRPGPISEMPGFRYLYEYSIGADGLVGNPETSAECLALYGPDACAVLAGGTDAPSEVPVIDDPLPPVLGMFDDFRFTAVKQRGGGYFGYPILPMGPWLPENFVTPIASMADIYNPLDNSNTSDQLKANYFNGELINNRLKPRIKLNPDYLGALPPSQFQDKVASLAGKLPDLSFGGALPFRPIPVVDEGDRGAANGVPRGLYIPSPQLREVIDRGRLIDFPFNYSETERAWNHGQSQQQTGELKELYLDLELFDSRLWLRLGRQTIIWGKTELFSAMDQFNPQDFGLATLPTLEESRIPLWSIRGTYSFYEVGPLSDVRVELGMIFDEFQPADLGACGEPYAVNPICGLTFGAMSHGFTGLGVIGVEHPPDPWESARGLQYGGRLEFRWDRFSFAVSDFYGYDDFPFPRRVVTYERNVDPLTGRPRIYGARGPCESADRSDPACLRPGPTDREGADSDAALADTPNNALLYHSANQTLFAFVCAATVGIASNTNPSACGASVFNGQEAFREQSYTSAQLLSAALAGSSKIEALGIYAVADQLDIPRTAEFPLAFEIVPAVTLHHDPRYDLANPGGCVDTSWFDNPINQFKDKKPAECGGKSWTSFDLQNPWDPDLGQPPPLAAIGLSATLTPEQEALLGCGPFWGTNCDVSGIDFLNAEGSVLVQSFPGIEGTHPNWRTDDPSVPQPGTVGFTAAPRCTTGHIGGPLDPGIKLPGCRGPGDPGYDPAQDGDPGGVQRLPLEEFMGQSFDELFPDRPEYGEESKGKHPFVDQRWQNELAALSWNFLVIAVLGSDNFHPYDAYTAGKCSFVTPQKCDAVQGLLNLIAVRRNVLRAGGNENYGRRDFQWHAGGAVTLAYQKRNVLGLALDFAEDRTKSSWGFEWTWVNGVPMMDNDEWDGISMSDEFNLTISVDRPTFINFLNANRSFFLNTQWFIQYRTNYGSGWTANGPWNVLGTLTILTGYFQDRLNPQLTFVYDVQSVSGAVLSEVGYRFTANLSATVGASLFFGREQFVDMPVNPIQPGSNRTGPHAYQDAVENGLSAVRSRDELFLKLRYSF